MRRLLAVLVAAALSALVVAAGAPFGLASESTPVARAPQAQQQSTESLRAQRSERRARQARKWSRRGYAGCRSSACAVRVKRARIRRAGYAGCRSWSCVARVKRKRAARLAAFLPYRGPDGRRWAIPYPIVRCESRGSWSAYNPSGAAGPYQIMAMHGRPWPVRSEADRLAHHRIAKRLWRGGAGASNWVCA